MALIKSKECNETVSTEAVACPHCGAPQQPPVPPPLPAAPMEETIYSDNAVTVTNMRVIIGGATYALRNITSVKMLFTPPRLVKPILLLIVGLMILLAAFFPINENAPAPASAYVIAGMMILGAILWMFSAKTMFHVGLSSASGEVHALTSKNKTYIVPIGGTWIMKRLITTSPKLQDMDISWAKVNLDSFQKTVSEDKRLKGKSFEYMIYQGTLEDIPDPKDPHLYAASNRVLLFPAPGKMCLEREFSYEFEMEYKGTREDGLFVFSIPKHKGHSYYKGASGSPIIEPSGKVLAILVQGCEAKNELYGYPLKGVVNFIKVGIDVERRGAAVGNSK